MNSCEDRCPLSLFEEDSFDFDFDCAVAVAPTVYACV